MGIITWEQLARLADGYGLDDKQTAVDEFNRVAGGFDAVGKQRVLDGAMGRLTQRYGEQTAQEIYQTLSGQIADKADDDAGLLSRAGDGLLGLARGTGGLMKSVADAVAPNSAFANYMQESINASHALQSDQAKLAEYQRDKVLGDKNASLWDSAKALGNYVLDDPIAFGGEVLGNVAPFVATGGVAGAAGLGARGVTALTGALGATSGAGAVRGSIWDKVNQADDAELQSVNAEYRALRDGGMSEADAKNAIGTRLFAHLPEIAAGAGVGLLSGMTGLEGAIAKTGAARPLLRGLAETAGEAAEEGVQELAGNYGYRQIDNRQDLFDGVGNAALMGAAYGAPSGGFAAYMDYANRPTAAPASAGVDGISKGTGVADGIVQAAKDAQDARVAQAQAQEGWDGNDRARDDVGRVDNTIRPENVVRQQQAAATTDTNRVAQGNVHDVVVSDRVEPIVWEVREASDMGAAIGKADNQFRDRNRAASEAQINSIARDLQFRRLNDAPEMDNGAPTVAKDGKTVIGGNGRVAAIKQAYADGLADNYRADLINQAARFGFTADQLAQFEQPVLVRRLQNDVDVQQAAIASNEGGSMAMSALEQAKADFARLPSLDWFEFNDDGSLNHGASAKGIQLFMDALPQNQRNALQSADGLLSRQGVQRIENAMLYHALGDSPALARAIEATDLGSRNVNHALVQSASVIAKARNDAAPYGDLPYGSIYDLDIADDVLAAADLFEQIKRDGGSVADFLAQRDFERGDLPVNVRLLLGFIDAHSRSAKAVRELIKGYYDAVYALGNPNEGDMFGDVVVPTREDLLKQQLGKTGFDAKGLIDEQTDGTREAERGYQGGDGAIAERGTTEVSVGAVDLQPETQSRNGASNGSSVEANTEGVSGSGSLNDDLPPISEADLAQSKARVNQAIEHADQVRRSQIQEQLEAEALHSELDDFLDKYEEYQANPDNRLRDIIHIMKQRNPNITDGDSFLREMSDFWEEAHRNYAQDDDYIANLSPEIDDKRLLQILQAQTEQSESNGVASDLLPIEGATQRAADLNQSALSTSETSLAQPFESHHTNQPENVQGQDDVSHFPDDGGEYLLREQNQEAQAQEQTQQTSTADIDAIIDDFAYDAYRYYDDIEAQNKIDELFKHASVRSIDAFEDLAISDRKKAFKKLLENGYTPRIKARSKEQINADYEKSVREIAVRRNQTTDTIRQRNGKPFRNLKSAQQALIDYGVEETHEVHKVQEHEKERENGSGFVLKRLPPARQMELRRKKLGIPSYAEAQEMAVREFGWQDKTTTEYVDGFGDVTEYDFTEEEWEQVEKRAREILREAESRHGEDPYDGIRYSRSQAQSDRSAYSRAKADGKTELTFEQWQQVRTPEFKAWFGDWENDPENASKVINPRTGEPLVVYHGTDAEFTVFDKNRINSNPQGGGYYGAGFYFTHELDTAKSYGKNVTTAFINIRKPLLNDGDYLKPIARKMGLRIRGYEFYRDGFKQPLLFKYLANYGQAAKEVTQAAIEKGFDGTASRENIDKSDIFVAFNPNQIKSATDNIGTFDPNNDDIRYSLTAATQAQYEQRIDDLFAGKTFRDQVRVLDRSDLLDMLGYGNQEVVLVNSKVNAAKHGNMTAEQWKKVPQWLDNPSMVFHSDTVAGRLVFIAPESVQGNPVKIILEPKAGKLEAHVLLNAYDMRETTAHEQDKHSGNPFRTFAHWRDTDRLLYIDKQKTSQLASRLGLLLPQRLLQPTGMSKILTEKNLAGYRQNDNGVDDSRSSVAVAQHDAVDVAQFEQVVRDALGSLARRVQLVFDVADEMPQLASSILANNYDGAFDGKTGKVYLFAQNLSPERAAFVAWHELGHRGYARHGFADYLSELRQFGGHSVVNRIADAIVADRKMAKDDPVHQSRDIALEEALVELYAASQTDDWDGLSERYGVEIPNVLKRRADGMIARVLDKIRAFVNKLFGHTHTDADLVNLLRDLHEDVLADGEVGEDGDTVYSRYTDDRDKITRALDNMGLDYRDFASGMSNSNYVEVFLPNEDGGVDQFKIRISDHALPSTYVYEHGSADFEVIARGQTAKNSRGNDATRHGDGSWAQAVAEVAQRTGVALPSYVKTVLDRDNGVLPPIARKASSPRARIPNIGATRKLKSEIAELEHKLKYDTELYKNGNYLNRDYRNIRAEVERQLRQQIEEKRAELAAYKTKDAAAIEKAELAEKEKVKQDKEHLAYLKRLPKLIAEKKAALARLENELVEYKRSHSKRSARLSFADGSQAQATDFHRFRYQEAIPSSIDGLIELVVNDIAKLESEWAQYQEAKKGSLKYSRNGKTSYTEDEKAAILQGAPVYDVPVIDVPNGYRATKEWAEKLFADAGGLAVNPEIGEVLLNARSVKDSLAHGISPKKKAAFEAVPSVIEQGALIAQAEHGNMTSYYVSAPVRIEGSDEIVTALIRKDANTQRMYLHSVMTKESLLNYPAADTEVSEPHGYIRSEGNQLNQKLSSDDVASILQGYLNRKVDAPDDGLRFSRAALQRPEQVLAFSETGAFDVDDGTMAQMYQAMLGDAFARAGLRDKAVSTGDKIVEAFEDMNIQLKRWADSLPDFAADEHSRQRLEQSFRLSEGKRDAANADIEQRFLNPFNKALNDLKKKYKNLSLLELKKLVGYWTSARYAPTANARLLEQAQAKVDEAQAAFDGNEDANKAGALEKALRRAESDLKKLKNAVDGVVVGKVAGGYSNPMAQQVRANIEKLIDVGDLEKTAQHLYDALAYRLDLDLQSGRISQEMYDVFKANKHYVPFTGDPMNPLGDDDNDVISGGSGINQGKDKAMKGRVSMAEDGVDATFRALTKSTAHYGYADFKDKLNDVYENAIGHYQNLGMDLAEARRMVAEEVGIVRSGRSPFARSSDRVIFHKVDGQDVVFELRDQVMNGLVKLNQEKTPTLLKPIATLTRWYARGVTQFAPVFAPMNAVRDMWEKSFNIRTYALFDANGQRVNGDKVANRALKYFLTSGGTTAKAAALGKFDGDNGQLLKELLDLGGVSTYGTMLSVTEEDMLAKVAKGGNTPLALLKKGVDKVERYNQAFDWLPSLSLYRALLDNGVDNQDAAAYVLETTNFRKRGAKMATARALYLFSQPTVIGAANMVRALKTSTGRRRFVGYLAVGMMLYAALRALDDEDEGGNKLDQMGDITRFIPIKVGDDYVKIPVGFGVPQLAWNMATNVMKAGFGDISKTEAAANMLAHWGKSIAPVAPSEISAAKYPAAKLTLMVTPSIFQPIVQNALNRNAFGSQITKGYVREDVLKAEQSKTTTAQEWKDLALWLQRKTGVDMHPEQLQNLVNGYALGVVRDGLTMAIENPNREAIGRNTRTPFFNSLFGSGNEFAIQSRYYEAFDEAKRLQAEYQSRQSRGDLHGWLNNERRAKLAWYNRAKQAEARVSRQKANATRIFNRGGMSDERYRAITLRTIERRTDMYAPLLRDWRKLEGLSVK